MLAVYVVGILIPSMEGFFVLDSPLVTAGERCSEWLLPFLSLIDREDVCALCKVVKTAWGYAESIEMTSCRATDTAGPNSTNRSG